MSGYSFVNSLNLSFKSTNKLSNASSFKFLFFEVATSNNSFCRFLYLNTGSISFSFLFAVPKSKSLSASAKAFVKLVASTATAFSIPLAASLASKVAAVLKPFALKPYSPYFCKNDLTLPFASSSGAASFGFLIFWIPLPAPTNARLNNAPSVPNFNLLTNLLIASSRPFKSWFLSIIVIASGSNDVPLAISANVPMSSSATTASPIPPPTTPPANLALVGVLAIKFPTLAKLMYLPARLAATAFCAKSAAVLACHALAAVEPNLKP